MLLNPRPALPQTNNHDILAANVGLAGRPGPVTAASPTRIVEVFLACDDAVRNGQLIRRASRQDKEFHFQDWFRVRLEGLGLQFDPPARNSYPDFRLVATTEGYEIKGLAYPGREASYDSNSQVPTGYHNGRTIFYVFGRYPADIDENEYPVVDLVLCHGDFLNADHEYKHKNKAIRGFGSYGDIMIRDRKMYVCPTPFALTDGTTAQRTLILPGGTVTDSRLESIGDLIRVEAERLVVGYTFDLRRNELTPEYIPNPGAGTRHTFVAYRRRGTGGPRVQMRRAPRLPEQ